ncbi:SusF/SusE family outer membrane protein [Olivibacter sp. SDN3]|uniref:SusE domain-containing protein n=1 Tax=Olivibacter sp. SDN3 TaxID=2764720 RepID=UPI00165141E8|nr:SusF/SusE family outer membrane protein [Olivibacter sp. SDN3]QNL49421.1 SusF/SusE family outer membrane protein [Olivibacter sp. SDN3]
MKLVNKWALLSVLVITLWSCKKDEDKVIVTTGDAPVLSTSAPETLVLRQDDAENTITFSWEGYAYSWSDPNVSTDVLNYVLQIGRSGVDFRSTLSERSTKSTSLSYTIAELNAALLDLRYEPGVAASVDIRLIASLAPNRPIYSNTITLQVTPYEDMIMYPSLFLAGSFNDWSHADAHRVGSVEDDGKYEGYVYFPNANTEFKFSSQAGWDGTNFGDGGEGSLDTDAGAGNLVVAEAGYYLLKADTEALTWSATKTEWGIIGDATGSWDSSTSMDYDTETGLWTVTANLSTGEWKFRANDEWVIDLGDSDKSGVLAYGGGNFEIEEPGTYLITLDLRNAAYYTYSLEIQ